jgi:hypothetical protein
MSALGPTIIFDKSLLQSLSEDESIWLDAFYHSIITPLFYIETLADLNKSTKSKTAEEIVTIISNKVPEMGSSPITHHRELVIGNLLGNKFDKTRRPILSGGKIYTINNKIGVVYDEHPEIIIFQRWQKREFYQIEKEIASLWRKSLAEFDYDYYLNLIKKIMGSDFRKPTSIEDSFDLASKIVNGQGHRYKTLNLLKDLVNIEDQTFKDILHIWNKEGMVSLGRFAPYASFVLKIDLFFILCTSSGLISRERKSNRADIAYLYYLPFANIFTSSDKLHKRIVHLFLDSDQRFIYGPDLKDDLSKLDDYFFESKSHEEKSAGVYSFAWYPPDNDMFLTTKMWDNLKPKWRLREDKENKNAHPQNKKIPSGLKEHIKNAFKEVKAQQGQKIPQGFNSEDANDLIIKRQVRGRRGRWQLFSDDIINSKERLDSDESDL